MFIGGCVAKWKMDSVTVGAYRHLQLFLKAGNPIPK